MCIRDRLIIEETATPAPVRLKAEAGNQYVALSWPAVAGAAGYHVYRATGDGPFTHIASRVTRPRFLDSDVAGGVTNRYVVSADGPRGESANSPEATAVSPILHLPVVPVASTNVQLTSPPAKDL